MNVKKGMIAVLIFCILLVGSVWLNQLIKGQHSVEVEQRDQGLFRIHAINYENPVESQKLRPREYIRINGE